MDYIEDILTKLVDDHIDAVGVQSRDYLIFSSFYNILQRGDSLTKSQGNLLIKMLNRYAIKSALIGFDYKEILENPEWKSRFRSLDLTKKIYVEKDDKSKLSVYVKFPYQLKEVFDKHISNGGQWDPNKKCRKFDIYQTNILQLYDFAMEHAFIIDESFSDALSEFEEILTQEENITPTADIVDGKVVLVNAIEDARNWWNENSKGNLNDDLMLAKSMGFLLLKSPSSAIEKIASEESNHFWMQSPREFLTLLRMLSGRFVFIVDRAQNNSNWLKEFTKVAEEVGFPSSEIKVCFRSDNNQDPAFNQWIRDSGYGGKVEEGRLLIFNHKPAKWVFKKSNDVKIIGTNNIYPPTDSITRDWMMSHPCVVYLGEIQPSKTKDKKIAKL
jgi:hypothetical protein